MLPAIIARPARAARRVSIAAFDGWFQAAFDTVVLGAFRKAHPDIAVFYVPVGNSFQSLGLLRDRRAFPSTDIALLAASVATRATSEGLLTPIGAETMAVIKDLIPGAVMPGIAGPALMLDGLAMAYSPAQITRRPLSWRNLWDSSYGQRIGLQTPPDPAALAMTAIAAAMFGGGELRRSLDAGLTALTQLVPRVVVWDPIPDIYTAVAVGDVGIGPGWNARAQNQAALTPTRFAAAIPEEGSPARITTINLVKGSPQPEAALILIAWLLGAEAQRLLTETLFFAPVNAKADIPAAALARAGASPSAVARRMETDWVGIDALRDEITVAWRKRNIGGR